VNLCNICVVKLRNKEWKELIKYADDALAVDHKCVKAIFMKGRGL
jgi:cytochrome c-type biogenesis protein CcmH/NrfG